MLSLNVDVNFCGGLAELLLRVLRSPFQTPKSKLCRPLLRLTRFFSSSSNNAELAVNSKLGHVCSRLIFPFAVFPFCPALSFYAISLSFTSRLFFILLLLVSVLPLPRFTAVVSVNFCRRLHRQLLDNISVDALNDIHT
jgi:hypothetical protein